jgi:hypothetical protein
MDGLRIALPLIPAVIVLMMAFFLIRSLMAR